MSRIHGGSKFFKGVTPLDVEFKPLLMIERALMDEVRGLYGRRRLGIDVEDEIGDREERLTRVRAEIVEKAMERIPRFMEIAEKLELDDGDVNALSALAGLLVYLRWPYEVMSTHKAMRYLGLCKPTRENVKKFEERNGERYERRYSGNARRYLNMLTMSMLGKKNIFPPRARHEKEVLRRLLKILRTYDEDDAGGGGRTKALMRPVVIYLVLQQGSS